MDSSHVGGALIIRGVPETVIAVHVKPRRFEPSGWDHNDASEASVTGLDVKPSKLHRRKKR